ncbi:MAG: integration host factor subunit beta [Alphaproteobacteria bacterium]|nr:integration host factor subunit beta [Alphaproteobacteria bacterium]
MVRSELVALIAARYEFPHHRVADQVVNTVLETIVNALALGRRVELRGFASFSVTQRPLRIGRNPRNGAPVTVRQKQQPRFRGSKAMRVRLNGSS